MSVKYAVTALLRRFVRHFVAFAAVLLPAGCDAPRGGVTGWEYKIVRIQRTGEAAEEQQLNRLGDAGWMLVALFPESDSDPGSPDNVAYTFRRRVHVQAADGSGAGVTTVSHGFNPCRWKRVSAEGELPWGEAHAMV